MMGRHLPTAFAFALVIFVAGLAVHVWGRLFILGDFPNGWATVIGAVLQVVAVYWAARAGFRAQEHYARKVRAEAARSVAAPIRAELNHIERSVRDHLASLAEKLEAAPPQRTDSNPNGYHFFCVLPAVDIALYEAQRPRLGELGAFLSYLIAGLYLDIARQPQNGAFSPDDWREDLRKVNQTEGALLSRIREVIELLRAVDATGATNEWALRHHVELHPTNWEPTVAARVEFIASNMAQR